MLEIAEPDSGQEYRVRLGDDVVIRLAETPTTGYRWRLSAPEALRLEEDGFEPGTSERPGAGGQRQLRLRATSAGTHQVELSRRRSWETGPGGPAERTFTVHVDP